MLSSFGLDGASIVYVGFLGILRDLPLALVKVEGRA